MPVIEANGCSHLRRSRGPGRRAGADPVQLAGHHAAYVGRPGRPVHQAFPAGALRPPRPWQIRPAQGSLLHGDAGTRRARDHGRARHQDRRTGAGFRWAAWKACGSAPTRRSASSGWCCPTRRASFRTRKAGTTASRWCATKACRRLRRRTWSAGSPRASASAIRKRSQRMREMFAATPLDGYIACGEAVRDMDHRDLLPRVKIRRWSSSGVTTPLPLRKPANTSAKNIPGAEHFMIDAAHISNVEQPQQFNDAVLGFLTRH